jgi:hypothetical protein
MTKLKNAPAKSQGKAFVGAARALGCDESEEHFDAALAKVARHKAPNHATNGTKAVPEKRTKRL